jgi:molybdate-binding protein/DNA-binding XRE family transcriptional regulator
MSSRRSQGAFRSSLKERRKAAGLTQKQLAAQVGLTRQALIQIEAGEYLPNTGASLRLARALGCRVEELFELDERLEEAVDLVGAGGRVLLGRVGGRLIGFPANPGRPLAGGYGPADALVRPGEAPELLVPADQLERTALVLGCDPALSLVRAHLPRLDRRCRAHTVPASSHAALEALRSGRAHVAGTHLVNASGEPDLGPAREALRECGGRVVTFALWDQGLVLAPGNPRGIRTLADLARPDVSLVDRPDGTGSRILLETALAREGIPTGRVNRVGFEAQSHAEVCHAVRMGLADGGVAVASLAEDAGLDFLPLGEVRFDLVVRADAEEHPAVRVLLALLEDARFRKELGALPSYGIRATGTVAAEV